MVPVLCLHEQEYRTLQHISATTAAAVAPSILVQAVLPGGAHIKPHQLPHRWHRLADSVHAQPCKQQQPCILGKGVSACSSAGVLYLIYSDWIGKI
jgi:hypothetical protein